MRQIELHHALVEEVRNKSLHHSREINRAHMLACLDRGIPEAGILRCSVWGYHYVLLSTC